MSDPWSPEDDVDGRFLVDFTGRTLLGIYRVQRKLADGGMGSVYLAEDTNLGRDVVVKVPHARFLGEKGFRARFRREVSELVRLEHPHVVRILARGEEDGVPFFVLQYLRGGSLEDRLRGKREDAKTAWEWLAPIAETLDFVHSRGVVHRDVKPGNILFDEEGHVFLSDFGVVKALSSDDEGERTAVGTGVGSPMYMAPEQGIGREVSGAADQYALASTLYEAIAGEPPFGRGAVVEILVRKQREPPKSLREFAPDVPEASDAAVGRALSCDPARRFASCREFAAEFGRGLAPAPEVRSGLSGVQVASLVLIAVLAAGALGTWFGLLGGGAPRVSDATPAGVLIQVANVGQEPRRRLRYRLVPGSAQKVRLTMTSDAVASVGALARKPTKLSVEQDVDVEVESVEADGRAHLKFHFLPMRQVPGSEVTPAQTGKMLEMHAALGNVTGPGTMAPRGGLLAVDLKAERRSDVPGIDPASDASDSMRTTGVYLPEPPVGKGAVWDVTRLGNANGIRYQETITYTLTEVEGERLRMSVQVRNTAPEQGLKVPGLEKEVQAQMRSVVMSGAGSLLLSLDRPLPLEYDVKSTTAIEVAATDGGKEETMHLDTTMEIHLRPR